MLKGLFPLRKKSSTSTGFDMNLSACPISYCVGQERLCYRKQRTPVMSWANNKGLLYHLSQSILGWLQFLTNHFTTDPWLGAGSILNIAISHDRAKWWTHASFQSFCPQVPSITSVWIALAKASHIVTPEFYRAGCIISIAEKYLKEKQSTWMIKIKYITNTY